MFMIKSTRPGRHINLSAGRHLPNRVGVKLQQQLFLLWKPSRKRAGEQTLLARIYPEQGHLVCLLVEEGRRHPVKAPMTLLHQGSWDFTPSRLL